ncbi:MAG: hypothetical protein AAGD43_12930 [Pseudomonadota bacterium]
MATPNNPRVFAETISLDVWRTDYSGDKAEADLHVEIGFFEGRLGGNNVEDSPVRFRLSLKRAEVHVLRDSTRAVRIPASSLARLPVTKSQMKTTSTSSTDLTGQAGANINERSASASVTGEIIATSQITKKIEREEDVGEMQVTHRKLPDGAGYVFIIEPLNESTLIGSPWEAAEPRMKIRDTKSNRKRGDPPEISIQLRCKREDLHIEDVQIKDPSIMNGDFLSRNKMIAVEQYIKSEILKMGFACGDLSEPFAELILGDAVSVEE